MMAGQLAIYWPGWLSGVVLSALVFAYFWATGRLLSSSGRLSIVIDRLRDRAPPEPEASPEELVEALRLASIEAFGASAVQAQLDRPASEGPAATRELRPRATVSWLGHLAFLVGLVLGGRASRPLASFEWSLGDGVWTGLVPAPLLPWLLLFAGVLVGFGTRMAGGCPIGHGLGGMARRQPGSWAAGLAFFAGGVGLSLLLGTP